MIEQIGFSFSEEFFAFLPAEMSRVLRRIHELFSEERLVWESGTQTFLVLNCLHEDTLDEAERQIAMIEAKLETSDTVTIRRAGMGVDIEAV